MHDAENRETKFGSVGFVVTIECLSTTKHHQPLLSYSPPQVRYRDCEVKALKHDVNGA